MEVEVRNVSNKVSCLMKKCSKEAEDVSELVCVCHDESTESTVLEESHVDVKKPDVVSVEHNVSKKKTFVSEEERSESLEKSEEVK